MENITFNNADVQVTSVFFEQDGGRVHFQNYPRQLMFKGHRYVLAEV